MAVNSDKMSLPEGFQEASFKFVQRESTLTLATTGKGAPWSTPVYYVFLENRFYFFSSPQSRHIQHAVETGQAAASLYAQAGGWKAIRGLQMTGMVEPVRSVSQSLKVISLYLKRFPFTRDFFPDTPAPDMESFFSRFKTRLYVFVPTKVFYTDNRFGFGTRRRIHWNK